MLYLEDVISMFIPYSYIVESLYNHDKVNQWYSYTDFYDHKIVTTILKVSMSLLFLIAIAIKNNKCGHRPFNVLFE